MWRYASSALAAIPCLLGSASAAAIEPTGDLEWYVPADCAHESDFRRQVTRLLDGRDALAQVAPVRVQITRRDDATWQLELDLTVEGTTVRRIVEAPRCPPLVEAATIIVVMATEPSSTPPSTVRQPGRSAPQKWLPPDTEIASELTVPARPSPPARSMKQEEPVPVPVPLRLGGGVGAHAGTGAVPGFSAAAAVHANLSYGPWTVRLEAAWWPSRQVHLDGRAAGAQVDLATVGVVACRDLVGDRWTLAACAELELGRLRARGVDVVNPREPDAFWAALGVGPALRWAISSRWSVWTVAGVAVPLRRPQFVVDGGGGLYRPAPAGFQLAAGLTFRLPVTETGRSEH